MDMDSEWDINANAIYRSLCETPSITDLDHSEDSNSSDEMRKVGKKWSTVRDMKPSKTFKKMREKDWVDSIVTGWWSLLRKFFLERILSVRLRWR